ncbi:hypothetical protein EA462_01900 [Natrarchaeobius halalkaliphilus]|uniref:PGF-CTERM sorting domain-containing protein n=1 Tax=Natrarchaeobius halalkaliphilus TaxID=1679091 RepID=A0A3N6M9L9_9EURY|nr:Hvo_1808 family surface protein [Natrarchaeobius halalkaliphilus]RQG92990.1 hypothetical protein EA462_01900 [Natrarchaeobius halalkaliphilus]
MRPTRTQIGVAFVAVAAIALLVVLASGGPLGGAFGESDPSADGSSDDRTVGPDTTETVGYVEGYWHDDDLPVDERDDAALSPDELEAVVYRSMARVEEIRGLTFENEVSVEIVSREEYRNESDDLFRNVSEGERLQQNVNFEALFVVDRATDAEDEFDSLYGGAVDGYYDPGNEEIVVVSDTPDAPETDEIILGHELLHALQDQQFDLSSFDRDTIDRSAATNGLVEGDAVWVETEYERRCGEEWTCVRPESATSSAADLNWGLYLIVYQPYNDGPDYVEYLREQDGGWAAVDAAYDDPPTSSAEVIRPGDDGERIDVGVPDRSSDDWTPHEVDGEVATETVGEVGMVSMFAAGAFDADRPTVLEYDAVVTADLGYEYDQPYTDGWAGDQLVTYVRTDDGPDERSDDGGEQQADDADGSADAVEETGYVWRTEWRTDEDAREFLDGYLSLLEGYDAEPVDDRANTVEIESDYPGAYAVDHDGQSVTIVRAPSAAAIDEIHADIDPDDTDSFELEDDEADATGTGDPTEDEAGDEVDAIGGTGAGGDSVLVVATVVAGTGVAIVVLRRRRSSAGESSVESELVATEAAERGPKEPGDG